MSGFIIRSKPYGQRVVTVDPQDAYLLRGYVWRIVNTSNHLYVARTEGGITILLHRYIVGAQPDQGVLFKNGDTFDLRRSNLLVDGLTSMRQGLAARARTARALIRLTEAL